MRIEVRPDICVGAGQCVLAARAVFDQGEDDGLVRLRHPAPGPAHHDAIREAIDRCPSGAIALHDN
ncbi:(4Fe-4S)-binding protein [Streptomyces carpaticus]|uniref:Ferredoxin n=2 Tax=Streptomyces TaxID=1883 RepID=A0A1I6PKF6_9ACTN|nr:MULTISPECIES: (4Fe-4S)-binding protein [Streptomyces]MCK1816244.1 (4Fe-4S)-binding protein [Streptomyces sp. XM4011]QKV71484.1 (4Fe-4S)-binding protein [Streptomyces harbinensis]UWM51933.1 (4Fe-4S)-binding protein [Streptomyces carpaticus]SFS40656.1 ferredoxin [Streptomyces harbinensis]